MGESYAVYSSGQDIFRFEPVESMPFPSNFT